LIVSLYAALLAIMYIQLSFRVIKIRRAAKVSLGDGNNPELISAIRSHGNFIEYVPLALILLFLLEYQGLSSHYCHAIGILLVLSRVFHSYALTENTLKIRVIGMALTFIVLALCAFLLLITSL